MEDIRAQTIRLMRYCQRTKEKIWAGTRRDLFNALPDIAEVHEIARRLYNRLEKDAALHKDP
jgi:hypothetical protein